MMLLKYKLKYNLLVSVILVLICILFVVLNNLRSYSIFQNYLNQIANVNEMDGVELQCKQVWNDVIRSREEKHNSRVSPTHMLIEELLEIVSGNGGICEQANIGKSEGKKLIILVNSARSHFNERQFIRDSWAALNEYLEDWKITTVFLLGQSEYCLIGEEDERNWVLRGSDKWLEARKEELLIENEQKVYGDLVVGSFTDAYRNNTYKHLMGYKFVLKNCGQVDLIVKTDDDCFVNVPMILDRRMEELRDGNISDLYCDKPNKGFAIRNNSKWAVNEEEWRTDYFPEFCYGAFLVMSSNWMRKVFAVRNLGGFLWMDDIFTSGILREVAEKEFGVKANIVEIKDLVWFRGIEKRNICKGEIKNVRMELPMFAQLKRDVNLKRNMKCLTDISLGKVLK